MPAITNRPLKLFEYLYAGLTLARGMLSLVLTHVLFSARQPGREPCEPPADQGKNAVALLLFSPTLGLPVLR